MKKFLILSVMCFLCWIFMTGCGHIPQEVDWVEGDHYELVSDKGITVYLDKIRDEYNRETLTVCVENENDYEVYVEIVNVVYNDGADNNSGFSFHVPGNQTVSYENGFDLSEIYIDEENTKLEKIQFLVAIAKAEEAEKEKHPYEIFQTYCLSLGEDVAINLKSGEQQ